MHTTQGRKIAVVGGSGLVGQPTLASLLSTGIHTITAITRAESDAKFPESVHIKKGDYSDESFLISALEGQDVLILQFGVTSYKTMQPPFIRAAAKAGVSWVLPTEFGSDSSSEILIREVSFLAGKAEFTNLIRELGMGWIGVVCNPWFDSSLEGGVWGIDVKARTAKFYDDGNAKVVTTTLPKVGQAVAAVLSLPDEELQKFKNEYLYISSFRLSQREILESVMRSTNTEDSDWVISFVDAGEAVKKGKEEFAKGNRKGLYDVYMGTHFRPGYGGDYQDKVVHMKKLGLDDEDLDTVVKGIIQKMEGN